MMMIDDDSTVEETAGSPLCLLSVLLLLLLLPDFALAAGFSLASSLQLDFLSSSLLLFFFSSMFTLFQPSLYRLLGLDNLRKTLGCILGFLAQEKGPEPIEDSSRVLREDASYTRLTAESFLCYYNHYFYYYQSSSFFIALKLHNITGEIENKLADPNGTKVAINCLTWLLAWKRKYTDQLDSSNSAINMACCKRITAAQVPPVNNMDSNSSNSNMVCCKQTTAEPAEAWTAAWLGVDWLMDL
ncbi:uncharacterized protein ARB_02475 [Trichophyton benhamiae CBS 112371]|uniref:Uncharacterized protein n=1 Tax=Arthroderma benhamiae (strain ATCC MYA-4681 / CBS 112371) TaxID=663331 RepID=D4B1Z4_ARTBC|nr:uncharacterized protein ARB_02475 [Trichophyton benhamiae CBS 112371]EFE30555.1 hypothetical protein ARB_02475 [Trichophyton benhamiae CBS 112371]